MHLDWVPGCSSEDPNWRGSRDIVRQPGELMNDGGVQVNACIGSCFAGNLAVQSG